ncbi:MAG: coproporphyrinogen III oxidase [Roseovarius sp.]|nr:coproporphyrinogen III oxidase [Roseovarius sp.]MBK45899.1 coproporphyrinogen III oxidase [Roseovarius sp.]
MAEDWQNGGFGLYVHWPFCQAKCPYCDFNSHVAASVDQARWRAAFLREIARHAELVPHRVLNSIFFGGGTPSLMPPGTVAGIIDAARAAWPTANDLEVTLEANPTSVEAGRFAAYADAGVNRVSLGVQALNDADLHRLGRLHTVEEAIQAFEIARKYFSHTSFDLIYARQDQSLVDWEAELRRALDLAADHLSLYQLTIEPGTAFGARHAAGKLPGLPEEGLAADMYQVTQEICGAAGLPAYEVSNHARSGSESRHNLIYWRYGDYIGIGPGAHGRLTIDGLRHATEAWSRPEDWLRRAEVGTAERLVEPLSPQEQATEFLLMGLRLSEGIDMARFERLSGAPLDAETVAHLAEIGMIRLDGTRLRATKAGRAVLNAVICDLLP